MVHPRPALLLALVLVMHGTHAAGGDSPIGARIVAGLPTADYPAAGALLVGDDPATAVSWCSGVLVGCQTFLTAAHCVCSGRGADCQGTDAPPPDTRLVYLQHAGFVRVATIAVHPDYDFPHADVAVLRLATPVTGIVPAPLAVNRPPTATAGTIVGFGRTGASTADLGLKRRGDIVIGTCPAGVAAGALCWTFDGGANTCQGDSGGPLVVETGGGPVVAGITSAGQQQGCLPGDTSIDMDVAAYRPWIAEAAGPDVERTRCGGLPPAGDPAAPVEVQDGRLGDTTGSETHTVEVPIGTNELRVTLNAVDDGLANFDLYVRAGHPATVGQHDCGTDGSGQYGACQVVFPAPGRWFVLVRRVAGAGAYQLTATAFGGDPPVCGNGVLETNEECDAGDDGACPGACSPTCACAGMCRPGGVVPLRASIGRRLSLKLLLRNRSGAYEGLDPRIAGLALHVDPEGGTGLDLTIPPHDPGWRGSGRAGDAMRWRGVAGGRKVEVRCKQLPAGHWRIRVQASSRP